MGQFIIRRQEFSLTSNTGIVSSEDKTRIEVHYQLADCELWFYITGSFTWNLRSSTDENIRIDDGCHQQHGPAGHVVINADGRSILHANYFAYSVSLTMDYPNLGICACIDANCSIMNMTVRDGKLSNMKSMMILTVLRNYNITDPPVILLLMSDGNHLYVYSLDPQAFNPSQNSGSLLHYLGFIVRDFRSVLESHVHKCHSAPRSDTYTTTEL